MELDKIQIEDTRCFCMTSLEPLWIVFLVVVCHQGCNLIREHVTSIPVIHQVLFDHQAIVGYRNAHLKVRARDVTAGLLQLTDHLLKLWKAW